MPEWYARLPPAAGRREPRPLIQNRAEGGVIPVQLIAVLVENRPHLCQQTLRLWHQLLFVCLCHVILAPETSHTSCVHPADVRAFSGQQ
jgi:hypothetical protein